MVGGVGVIHMINETHAMQAQMIVMAKKSLKNNDHREMLTDSDSWSFADDIDRSSGTCSVSVTVTRSG